jgi:hypothetical protein
MKAFLKIFDFVFEDESMESRKGFIIDAIELSLAINASSGFEFALKGGASVEGWVLAC